MRLSNWVLSPDGTYRECRNCGQTVHSTTSSCPNCGSTDIAVYEL